MPKIYILGDIHGMKDWLAELSGRAPGDHAVFIGDYMDPYGNAYTEEECLENFLHIMDYARKWPNTFLLIGNHDFHYMPGCRNYSTRRAGKKWAEKYREAFAASKDYMRAAYGTVINGRPAILTHAGVTCSWLLRSGLTEISAMPEKDFGDDYFNCAIDRFGHNAAELAAAIDGLFRSEPEKFDFIAAWGADPSGDDPFQGPLWVRPNSLIEDAPRGFDQYVGHTRTIKVICKSINAGDGDVFFVNLAQNVGCIAEELT